MFIVKYYLGGALGALLLAYFSANILVSLPLIWIGLSLLCVGSAYLLQKPAIFRKKQDGSIPFYIRWVFIPFLLGVQLYNSWARKHDKVPAIQKIDDDLYLACRLFPSDVEQLHDLNVKAILDVTAEFDGLDWTATSEELAYLNVPVLDHQSPSEEDLIRAVNWIDNHRRAKRGVVVHCALGRGRSVLVMAAYLLRINPKMSVRQAISSIQDVRETARLNSHQLRALCKVFEGGKLSAQAPTWLIANPVSGAGKWPQNREFIEQRLSGSMQLKIVETTPDVSAKNLAKQAIEAGASRVIACGGDGTLTEVASVLVNTNVHFAIIPMGTANALAHALFGAKSKVMPIEVACEHIENGVPTKIDTANCNEHLMLLVTAVGFEQKMIEGADRDEKNQGGQMAYIKALWEAVNVNDSLDLRITIDDEAQQSLSVCSLVVANAAPFTTVLAQGGGEPDATDGELDLTWLPPQTSVSEHMFSLSELIAPSLFADAENKNVHHQRIKKIKISADQPLNYVIDGETYQDDALDIRINPSSLIMLIAPEQ
ncbi:diacylglycerol kinase family protein [Paraglaciecola sp. 20A4]|uniref:diacylglycerol kinase family protein n=1 Tax=Paraglaciecola sp. 20A4 TaxID=2687288 RepID=UPI00140A5A0D|nr:diacylglycerol kinase family protein [Paraglaciecola sp. 20A4]